ncbi:MAG: hypothetical protein OSJ74_00165 [Clostridia bacterium]|nr:hypothetical protein [Clostridia bacterium]
MKSVYIIMSPNGDISLNMFSGKGKAYENKEQAEEALKSKNEWSKVRGYGTYELVELEVEE